jgi:hypothetical protein
VRGGWPAVGSWEVKYEGGGEVEVGSSAGFILDVGSRSLSFDAAAWRTALERPGEPGIRFPDLGPRFPVAESPT